MVLVVIYGLLLLMMVASIVIGIHSDLPKTTIISQITGTVGLMAAFLQALVRSSLPVYFLWQRLRQHHACFRARNRGPGYQRPSKPNVGPAPRRMAHCLCPRLHAGLKSVILSCTFPDATTKSNFAWLGNRLSAILTTQLLEIDPG